MAVTACPPVYAVHSHTMPPRPGTRFLQLRQSCRMSAADVLLHFPIRDFMVSAYLSFCVKQDFKVPLGYSTTLRKGLTQFKPSFALYVSILSACASSGPARYTVCDMSGVSVFLVMAKMSSYTSKLTPIAPVACMAAII